jgi:hypothetical protein
MKRQSWILGASMLVLALATQAGEIAPAGIARVAWLAGRWEAVGASRTVEEHWMTPRDGCMLGMSRTTAKGSLVEYELIVLRQEGDQLAYQAHPSGQPTAVFLSKTLSDSTVIFENLEHDFPQRVGYVRRGADSLVAWIEGTREGKVKRIEFPYRRAASGSPGGS